MVRRSGKNSDSVQDLSASKDVRPGRQTTAVGVLGAGGMDSDQHSPNTCRAVNMFQALFYILTAHFHN